MPPGFRARMRELLGAEASLLEASLAGRPVTGLRVNTTKLASEELERLAPWPLEPVPWCPSGFRLGDGGDPPGGAARPGAHPFHAAGLYYLQEPSAMAVAEALAPRPGETVLDLAAAPGGKSTHVASLLGDSGLLVANDANGRRARELSRNLERWGARRAIVTSAAPEDLARVWPARFDAVLLDAPCSGEGMFRKSAEALRHWSEENVAACALRQEGLLADAARLVRPGGRLAYSTCTLEPAENEQVVSRFLEANRDWALLDPKLAGVSAGRSEWAAGERAEELTRAIRLWPHRQPGEGHFVAVLRRPDGAGGGAPPQLVAGADGRLARRGQPDTGPGTADSRQASALWRRFVRDDLTGDPVEGRGLVLRRDGLYAVPPGAPDLSGVTALRPGLWLGTVERERFEPSHALALALRRQEVVRAVELEPDDPELAAYLAGAELERPGDDGWVLVLVAGYPIGWGRRGRDIVKNRYPKGLRRQPGR
jgi:NOL1/NOP2/sun family putative RNA methylase